VSIKLIRLSKHYNDSAENRGTIEAVRNINLDINEGSVTLLYGTTGSGKTTLLSLMAGITAPTYGEIVLNNIHGSRALDREITRFRERYIGYVPQQVLLIKDLTILENVLYPNLFGEARRSVLKKRALWLMERLGIAYKRSAKPHELSGGEKKKAMIVRALIKNPAYVLADEPVAELDRDSAADILKLFYEYNKRGSALLIASHKKLQMKKQCDVYLLHQGQIVEYARGGRR
jgi:ABC-type lipoprotein export system ATPase subunit